MTKDSILDRIDSIEFDKNENHKFGIKSGIVWGYTKQECYPLLYLSKPKSVSEDDYRDILNRLILHFSK